MKYQNQVELRVYGKNALFSDPITNVGGEKCSYAVPTYSALKGIVESCYWKPTIIWHIDEVRVMNPIRMECKGVRTVDSSRKPTLSAYSYLTDVEYRIRAHFERNENRPELWHDFNENKHFSIAKRSIACGGRRDVYLGTRECQAYVDDCPFDEGVGYYDDKGSMKIGFMLHGINYPDEMGDGNIGIRYWYAEMENGVIKFPAPELFKPDCDLYPLRIIQTNVKSKIFIPGVNMQEVL